MLMVLRDCSVPKALGALLFAILRSLEIERSSSNSKERRSTLAPSNNAAAYKALKCQKDKWAIVVRFTYYQLIGLEAAAEYSYEGLKHAC